MGGLSLTQKDHGSVGVFGTLMSSYLESFYSLEPHHLSCLPPFSLLFCLLLFLFFAARPGDKIVKTVNNNSSTTIENQDTKGFYLGVET